MSIMEKKVSIWILALISLFSIFGIVLFGWLVQYATLSMGPKMGRLAPVVLTVASFPTLVKSVFFELTSDSPLIIPNRFPYLDWPYKNGRIQKGTQSDDGFLLLSAYDKSAMQSIVKLIRISDQKIMHTWIPDLSLLKKSLKTEQKYGTPIQDIVKSRYRIYHPLLLNNGDLIFGEGTLFRIDKCSHLVTTFNGVFHHSKELDSNGDIWAPSTINPSRYDSSVFYDFRDDSISKIDLKGEVLYNKSVATILSENGYDGLLWGVGNYRPDSIHLNDVQPALNSTKYWNKGDLLVSVRDLSTVFLFRPTTNKIIWLKTGPWLKQHDANFVGNSTISIFGNDVIDYYGKPGAVLRNGHNNIYLYNFSDGTIERPFETTLYKNNVQTRTEGRATILENGDAFIEETNDGRILRISPNNVIWELSVRVNSDSVGMLGWSRYYSKKEMQMVLKSLEDLNCSN